MDRDVWRTSGLRIRTWEIGTAGTEWGGGQGTPATYLGSTYLFDASPDTILAGTYRVLRAQLARATEGRCQGSPGNVQ